jgi:predicted  nucleic acid-binding Zn-ribbon protein
MSRESKAAALYQLQQLDLEVERLNAEEQSISAALRDDSALRQATQELEAARHTLRQRQRVQQQAEQELASLAERIKAHQDRLYSGSISNPRELGALQQEIQHLRETHSAQEDRVLEAMSAVDDAQAALTDKAAKRDAAEQARQHEQGALQERLRQAEEKLNDLRQRRQRQAESCEAALLQRYEQARKARGGKVVALAEGGTCQWCRVTLRVSEMQRLRLGAEIVTCSNCGRILHLP